MNIEPFVAVDGVSFTIREAQLRARLGAPLQVLRSAIGLREMDYGDAVYRFQDTGRLEEITKRGPVVHFGPVAVPFNALAAFISDNDDERFERAGFVVSPRFGMALVPDQGPWVTALARHCLTSWRQL